MTGLLQNMKMSYSDLLVGLDPVIDNWAFMKSPIPIISILVAYLYFVLKLGPEWMAKRKPFELKKLLILYNAYQVFFSIWLCVKVFDYSTPFQKLYHTDCKNQIKTNPATELYVWNSTWWYFFSKIIELLDTVFFVLRKKQNQVTFLHVYHHSIMAFFTWGYLKYLPSEQGLFLGFLNSFVHVIMYFYYMVAAMGPQYQKYLWWKKYMTRLQLGQFAIMLVYLMVITTMDCRMPRSLTYFFVSNIIIFIYLFSDFYRKAYIKKRLNDANNILTSKQNINDNYNLINNNNYITDNHNDKIQQNNDLIAETNFMNKKIK